MAIEMEKGEPAVADTEPALLEPIVWIVAKRTCVPLMDLSAQLEAVVPREWYASPPRKGKGGRATTTPSQREKDLEEQRLKKVIDGALRRLEGEGRCQGPGQGSIAAIQIVTPLPDDLRQRLAALDAAEDEALAAGLALLQDGKLRTEQELRTLLWPGGSGPANEVTRKLIAARVFSRMGGSEKVHCYERREGDSGTMCFQVTSTADIKPELERMKDGSEPDKAGGENVQPGAGSEAPSDPAQRAQPDNGDGHADPSVASLTAKEILIDPEFAKLLPPHSAEEILQLEENLLAEGECRDALVLWKGRKILLEGFTRLKICTTHNLPFTTVEVEVADRDEARAWIVRNQVGRRNASAEWLSSVRGTIYNARKQAHGGSRVGEPSSSHSENLKTAEVVAKEFGVSPATICRDGDFARDLDQITETCGEEVSQAILSGQSGATRKEVTELAQMPPAEQPEAARELLSRSAARGPSGDAKKAKATPETIKVPVEPMALAACVRDRLGTDVAKLVYVALGKLLAPDLPSRPANGRRQGRRAAGRLESEDRGNA